MATKKRSVISEKEEDGVTKMGWFSEFSTQELEKSSEDQIILFKRPLLVSFIHLTFFRFHCFHRQLHPYISHLMCL